MIFRNIFSTFVNAEVCAKYIFYHTMIAFKFKFFLLLMLKTSQAQELRVIINTQTVAVALGP